MQHVVLLSSLFGVVLSQVQRPYHLDYLDVETMDYYLSAPKEDFDVAVLFYAQWCSNCHAFAPYWDQISRIHQAGTEQSKLIMGLFDCEEDAAHSEICNRAGVKHYPTISFFSLSGQKFSLRKPRHATQFGGNWQYGDAVYDWLKTLGGLSNWHRLGWGKKLRSLFFGGKKEQPKDRPLPMGIPGQALAGKSTATGKSTNAGIDAKVQGMESQLKDAKIQELESQVKEYSEIAVRSSILLDALLFPLSTGEYVMETNNHKKATDVFQLMADTDGWTSNDNVDIILKTCLMEISLDYCSRLSTSIANDWVSKQSVESVSDDVMTAFTAHLNEVIPESEPYCLLVEDCILSDYAKEECRPKQCPFRDPAACRYVSACLSPEMQSEYATALNLTESLVGGGTAAEPPTSSSKPTGAWGI